MTYPEIIEAAKKQLPDPNTWHERTYFVVIDSRDFGLPKSSEPYRIFYDAFELPDGRFTWFINTIKGIDRMAIHEVYINDPVRLAFLKKMRGIKAVSRTEYINDQAQMDGFSKERWNKCLAEKDIYVKSNYPLHMPVPKKDFY